MLVFDDTQVVEKKISLYEHQVSIKDGTPQLNKAIPKYLSFENKEPLKEECRSFVHCIQTGNTPLTDGREGLKVLKVLESAQACIDSKKGIDR